MFSNFSRHGSSWIDTPTCKTCKMPPDVHFLMTCRHRHVRNFQKSSKIMKINIFWRCLQFGLQLRGSAGPSISIPDQGSNLRSIYRFNTSKRGKVFQVYLPGSAKNADFSIFSELFAPRLLLERHTSIKSAQNSHFCRVRLIRHTTTRNAGRSRSIPSIWDSGFM